MLKSLIIITLILNSLTPQSQDMSLSDRVSGKFERISIESRKPGLKLSLLHLSPQKEGIDKPPVLFIHGASFPSALAFGFRMNGYSWMDDLSLDGYDTYALDFLGYGSSDKYPEMLNNDNSKGPLGRGVDLAEDIDIAVNFILEKNSYNSIYLIGHSWGGAVAGHYATVKPSKIRKLVLFAPVVQREGPAGWKIGSTSYQELTPSERISQFVDAIPEGETNTLEKDILDKWGEEWLKSDMTSSKRQPPSVRFPASHHQRPQCPVILFC